MAYPDPRGSPKVPLVVTAAVIAAVWACDRPDATAPPRTVPRPNAGVGDPNTVSWTPADYIGTAPWEPNVLQPDTVTVVLASPVQTVWVGGNPASLRCDNPETPGAYGIFIAYDASGNEVGRANLKRYAPGPFDYNPGSEECGDPNAPGGSTYNQTWDVRGEDTITVATPSIVRVKITPFTKGWTHTNYDALGNPFTDISYIAYWIDFPSPPPDLTMSCTPSVVTRGDTVSCNLRMSDNSAFNLLALHSTAVAGGQAIFDWTGNVTQYGTYDWRGPALLSSNVRAIVGGGGGYDTATSSFTVRNRVGLKTGWKDPAFSDAGFPTVAPSRFRSGAPLNSTYPGFNISSSGSYGWDSAGIGITFTEGWQATATQIAGGPNAGASYVRSNRWRTPGGLAVGIYLSKGLDSTDAFYKKQIGPPPYCTLAQMDTIYQGALAHELGHWNDGRSRKLPLKVTTVLDTLVASPANGGIAAVMTRISQLAKAWRDSGDASYNVVHTDAAYVIAHPACNMRQP